MRRGRWAAAVFLLLLAVSCTVDHPARTGTAVTGSGAMASETRMLAAFNAVDLRAVGTVSVAPGAPAAVTIDGEDNLLPLITTRIQQGRLVIDWKAGTGQVSPTRQITYHLTAPENLAALNVHGAGAIRLGVMQGDTLRLGVDGAGSITVDGIEAGAVVVGISGAGQIRPSGRADHQQLTIDGLGTYAATGLATRQADVTITGAGHAEVQASDVLNTTITGLGNVLYVGAPRVTRSGDGLGRVVPVAGQ